MCRMSNVLGLPSLWVFIEYEDGRRENVGNRYTLDPNEAHYFWKLWNKEKENNYHVRYVSLENKGQVYEKYEFNIVGDVMVRDYKNRVLGFMPITG